MHALINQHIESLRALSKKYQVKTMYVFGSSVRDSFSDSSDIDILISFKDITIEAYTDNFFNLHHDLEGLFGRKVDLITESSLSNPYLIESILESRQLVYAA